MDSYDSYEDEIWKKKEPIIKQIDALMKKHKINIWDLDHFSQHDCDRD